MNNFKFTFHRLYYEAKTSKVIANPNLFKNMDKFERL